MLSVPVVLDGMPLDVGGSIGIAIYPDHGDDFATLLRHADVAMYDAKARGDAVAVYAPEADHNSPERLSLLADLRRRMENTESSEVMLLLPAAGRDRDRRGGGGRGAAALASPAQGADRCRRS